MNDQYIWHKNNMAQLNFILGRAIATLENFQISKMHMVKTHFLLDISVNIKAIFK